MYLEVIVAKMTFIATRFLLLYFSILLYHVYFAQETSKSADKAKIKEQRDSGNVSISENITSGISRKISPKIPENDLFAGKVLKRVKRKMARGTGGQYLYKKNEDIPSHKRPRNPYRSTKYKRRQRLLRKSHTQWGPVNPIKVVRPSGPVASPALLQLYPELFQ